MEDELMRYMLLQSYGAAGADCPPISEWAPEDIRAHIEFQRVLNAELLDRGELIDAQGLAGPERAIEIAARISAAPGANGTPIRQAIEVRAVLSAPDPEV